MRFLPVTIFASVALAHANGGFIGRVARRHYSQHNKDIDSTTTSTSTVYETATVYEPYPSAAPEQHTDIKHKDVKPGKVCKKKKQPVAAPASGSPASGYAAPANPVGDSGKSVFTGLPSIPDLLSGGATASDNESDDEETPSAPYQAPSPPSRGPIYPFQNGTTWGSSVAPAPAAQSSASPSINGGRGGGGPGPRPSQSGSQSISIDPNNQLVQPSGSWLQAASSAAADPASSDVAQASSQAPPAPSVAPSLAPPAPSVVQSAAPAASPSESVVVVYQTVVVTPVEASPVP